LELQTSSLLVLEEEEEMRNGEKRKKKKKKKKMEEQTYPKRLDIIRRDGREIGFEIDSPFRSRNHLVNFQEFIQKREKSRVVIRQNKEIDSGTRRGSLKKTKGFSKSSSSSSSSYSTIDACVAVHYVSLPTNATSLRENELSQRTRFYFVFVKRPVFGDVWIAFCGCVFDQRMCWT
jgi:hypothetical protein